MSSLPVSASWVSRDLIRFSFLCPNYLANQSVVIAIHRKPNLDYDGHESLHLLVTPELGADVKLFLLCF